MNVVNKHQIMPMDQQYVEIVERKGLGHPDTICDALADEISKHYCQKTMDKWGVILHHNFDKSLLSAGQTHVDWWGGLVTQPIKLHIGDRATFKYKGEDILPEPIVGYAVYNWLQDNVPLLNDPDRFEINCEPLKHGSDALVSIFDEQTGFMPSNDTSATVGYAPLSELENNIIMLEKHLQSLRNIKEYLGADIKIMGERIGEHYNITIAAAMVSPHLGDIYGYQQAKAELQGVAYDFLMDRGVEKLTIDVNTLDDVDKGKDGCYLTVTGTSAEEGDSGQIGRGNNVKGVIPLCRPISSEAAAGKNPVSHIGKIYNHLAFSIADTIYMETDLEEVYVHMMNQIGKPVDEPRLVLVTCDQTLTKGVETQINSIIEDRLAGLGFYISKLIRGFKEG